MSGLSGLCPHETASCRSCSRLGSWQVLFTESRRSEPMCWQHANLDAMQLVSVSTRTFTTGRGHQKTFKTEKRRHGPWLRHITTGERRRPVMPPAPPRRISLRPLVTAEEICRALETARTAAELHRATLAVIETGQVLKLSRHVAAARQRLQVAGAIAC